MKRKLADVHSDSDSDAFNGFQSQRKRRRRIVEDSSQSPSDDDTKMNHNEDEDSNSQQLSVLHISSHETNDSTSDGNTSEPQNNDRHKPHSKKPWNCDACTFKNEKQFNKCEICDTNRTNHDNTKHTDEGDDNDTANSAVSDADNIEMETNDFKKVRSTKQFRKKDKKLTKQCSIVDLTGNDAIYDTKQTHKTQQKISIFTTKSSMKKVAKATNKKGPQISCIGGHRSRSKYYANLIHKKKRKVKKKPLSKTESIESVDQTELVLNTKHNVSDSAKTIKKSDDIYISDDDDCVIVKTTNKTKGNNKIKLILDDDQTQQWIDKYAPKHIDDLYLHKKKLNDIDTWFCNALKALDDRSVKCILFLVGQSGIGKTSVIHCLCDKYNAKLLCYPSMDANIKMHNQSIWDNDDTHFMNFSSMNRYRRNIDIKDDTQMNKFNAFLNRSKRFGSLNLFGTTKCINRTASDAHGKHSVSIHKRQVILIKELPYVGRGENKYKYKFREIVERMCNSTRNIVIFEITTEFEGTKDCLEIFGNTVRLHPRVSTMKFNAINNTLMKKCLNHIILSENLNKSIVNSKALITNIIENEKGDLRNAIQTLQMRLIELSYCGEMNLNLNGNIDKKQRKKGKKRSKKGEYSSLSSRIGGREETLSLFHCLGKILYAKKEMDPEDAIEKSDLDCMKFNDLLHENAPDFFVYNEHFNALNDDGKKELDEFGFEIDNGVFDDNGFDKYCDTLRYFSDADICSEYYNKLKYSDTSTDLRSTVNHIQFGSQLYPAIYAASIAARGYLLSHDKQPKLKMPQVFGQNRYKKSGFNSFRGSTSLVTHKLRQELRKSIDEVIVPKKSFMFAMDGNKQSEDYVEKNELGLLRAFKCHPTSLYVDMFPLISEIKKSSIEKECGIKPLCAALIRTSNWYSMKYEYKKFVESRFDYIHNEKSCYAIANNGGNNENEIVSDDDKHLLNEIEEFSD